ncbi:MAG: carbohydrate ABC transporter permease [Aristaeellaceae bacterium]
MTRTTLLREMKKNRAAYIMLAPFFVLFCVFVVLPVLSAILLSFTSFNMLSTPRFVGFENYIRMFLDDAVFLNDVRNTLIFALLTGPVSYFACLFLAWFVNELSRRARTIMTFLLYVPSMSGGVFVIWKYIFSGDKYGLINSLLIRMGVIFEPIQWLTDTSYMLTIAIIVQIWMSLGTAFLAFIAGFQGIDRQMYESAAIDGVRNRWQELWYITLPSMSAQLLFGAVMQIGSSFAAGAVSAELFGSPSTDYAADTIVTHMSDMGIVRFEMGYASAISVVLFIMMLLFNKWIRKALSHFSDD